MTSSLVRSKLILTALVFVSLMLAAGSVAQAQLLYGTLTGNVTDSRGAVIPKAQVRATLMQTGEIRKTSTNAVGEYSLTNVPQGLYEVTVQAAGFSEFSAPNVQVFVNSIVRVDADMQVGAQTSTVTVNEAEARLQTDSAMIQQDVTERELQDLPVPSYNYANILSTVPGVEPLGGFGGGTNNPAGTAVLEANGTSEESTDVRVDGVSAVNPWVQYHSTLSPSIDSIATLNVVTSNSDADQTLAGGTTINVLLKSGTNELHGSAAEHYQGDALGSRNYFTPPGTKKTHNVDNDATGTLGGPIIKDKLFFFGAYEGHFIHSGGGAYGTVPVPAMLQGDFSSTGTQIYDPATGGPNGSGKLAFPNNQIPTERFDPAVKQLLSLIPAPNTTAFGTPFVNNFFTQTPNTSSLQSITGKIDWATTQALRINGRFNYQPYKYTQTPLFGHVLGDGSTTPTQDGHIYALTVAANYLVRANLVVDGSFGYTWTNQLLLPTDGGVKYGSDVLHIPGVNLSPLPAGGGLPTFNISNGYTGYGYGYPYLQYLDPVFQYSGNASWTKGKHSAKFGVNVSQQHMNHIENNNDAFSFNGGATALNTEQPNQFTAYADFLLGAAQGVQNSYLNFGRVTLRQWQYALYAGDKWDITKKLTITYGTSWEYFPVPSHVGHGIENYNPDTNQYYICGGGGVPLDCGIHVQPVLFGPKGGFAYRPTENMVIRGGYGINTQQQSMARDGLYNYPEDIQYMANSLNPYAPLSYVSAGIPVTPSIKVTGGYIPLPTGQFISAIPHNFVRGYTESYNLTLQQLFGSWLFSVGYVGTHTVHQHTRYNINYGQVGGGVQSGRLYQLFGQTTEFDEIYPFEHMNYNSLQVTLQHRFRGGFLIDTNYTWAKWLGTCCDINGDGAPEISIPEYYQKNYAPEPGDIRSNFHFRAIAELPFGKGKPFLTGRVSSLLAGGWQANLVFTAHSGFPFTVFADGTSLNAPGSTQVANQVKSSVKINHNLNQWFDITAFQPVTTAAFGTSSFDELRGPIYKMPDFGLSRSFKVTERVKLHFRVDAFNLFNSPVFGTPNSNIAAVQYGTNGDGSPNYNQIVSSNGFGQITGGDGESAAANSRNLRLTGKITF